MHFFEQATYIKYDLFERHSLMHSFIQEIYLNVHRVKGTRLGAVEMMMSKAQSCPSGLYKLGEFFKVFSNK